MPREIAELLDEWVDIDPGTAKLIPAAVSSGESHASSVATVGGAGEQSLKGSAAFFVVLDGTCGETQGRLDDLRVR